MPRSRPAERYRARIAVVGGDRDPGLHRTAGLLESEPSFDVRTDHVAGHGAGRDRLALLDRTQPDVVLVGRFPGRPELTALMAREVVDAAGRPSRLIALAAGPPDAELRAVLRAGAIGFLRADARRTTVLEVILRAAEGAVPSSPAATTTLATAFAAPPRQPGSGARLSQLTRRERDVLRLVAKGLSNGEIAAALVVTTSTVKTHMNAILGKLGLRDRVQATVFAYESGLIRPGGP
ncbi:LuxR C-terminal-related transcriptional regulator [Cryptosporangium arvum]|jgi:DNA-binding NarL/FixJ family response regulator|uniref:Response regulator containing a CheY-like receiver domain and an HTH DNA-binding domain n=1 Tax=Cryptosporangium arvum DSM 44712 TaxID=927661 RepID=A0A010YFL7_9ACTN|nr:response regulator transcription factor [Cryptosporangium arvum]EXG79025.1 response regulator containing a CheY-like receiver domain and an HTH DNA-binding domain [Cryptosporangium arvum DSM 44712]